MGVIERKGNLNMKIATGIIVLGLCIGAQAAGAQQVFGGAGKISGTSTPEVTALAEGHMVVHLVSAYENFEMSVPDHPYNGMTGKCFGSVEVRVPGANGGGNCVFSNDAGETSITAFAIKGMAADGAMVGSWSVIGGTGKFAGATGGGSFHSLTDNATGKFVNTVDGALVLK
jgi:hypothetical protein